MKKILHGRKVLLRPLTQGDMPARVQWTTDRELCLLMGVPEEELHQLSANNEVDSNHKWLEARCKSGITPYAVEVNGRYIGDIDFGIYPNKGMADLTVFLGDRREWGKGYGTEAVELVIRELFDDERINVIEVDVAPQNDRAFSFWTKLGFSEYRTDDQGTRYLRRFRDSRLMKVALASSKVIPEVEQNFVTVAGVIKQAVLMKPDLICFPEASLGFEVDDYQAAKAIAIEIPGGMTQRIASFAEEYGLYIAIGVLEYEQGKIYDSALLFSDTGKMILKHRRVNPQWHEPSAPKDRYGEGTEFQTVHTPFGKVGFAICGDTGDAAVRALIREAKPDLILNPRSANFDDFSYNQKRWDREKVWACDQAVDMDARVFLVNAFSERCHGGAYGGSMVVSRRGKILRESRIGKPSILYYQGPSSEQDDELLTKRCS